MYPYKLARLLDLELHDNAAELLLSKTCRIEVRNHTEYLKRIILWDKEFFIGR